MKPGDIVVCIDNKLWSGVTYTIYPLTIKKQYKVLYISTGSRYGLATHIDNKWRESSTPWIMVKCDDESEQHFALTRFISLREYNLNKLKI